MRQIPAAPLADGEEILWTGQTTKIRRAIFNWTDIFTLPIITVWELLVLKTTYALSVIDFTDMFFDKPLLAVVLISMFTVFNVAGLYMLLGRFIYKYCKYKNNHYIVTNRRLLINNKKSGYCRHIDIDKIAAEYYLYKKVKKDNRGIIMLVNKVDRKKVEANNEKMMGAGGIGDAYAYVDTGLEFLRKFKLWNRFYTYDFVFFYIDDAEEVYRLITRLMAREQEI